MVDVEDMGEWPPGSLMRFNSLDVPDHVAVIDRIDHLGIVISNDNSRLIVWWPRGRQQLCTYLGANGRIGLNKKVITKFL